MLFVLPLPNAKPVEAALSAPPGHDAQRTQAEIAHHAVACNGPPGTEHARSSMCLSAKFISPNPNSCTSHFRSIGNLVLARPIASTTTLRLKGHAAQPPERTELWPKLLKDALRRPYIRSPIQSCEALGRVLGPGSPTRASGLWEDCEQCPSATGIIFTDSIQELGADMNVYLAEQ